MNWKRVLACSPFNKIGKLIFQEMPGNHFIENKFIHFHGNSKIDESALHLLCPFLRSYPSYYVNDVIPQSRLFCSPLIDFMLDYSDRHRLKVYEKDRERKEKCRRVHFFETISSSVPFAKRALGISCQRAALPVHFRTVRYLLGLYYQSGNICRKYSELSLVLHMRYMLLSASSLVPWQ